MSESQPSAPRIIPSSLAALAADEVAAESGAERRNWRSILRRGLPAIGVIMVIALVGGIATYVYETNRRGALALSNDLIASIDRRVGLQLQAYMAPAEQFLELSAEIAGSRGVFDGGPPAEELALKAMPKIAPALGFSYADPDGNFLYVVRNSLGGYDTKTVDRRGGGRKVTWVRRDAQGALTETGDDPSDMFDPRERPWYKGAVAARKPFWTDTYVFFTVHKPGITFALPQYDQSGKLRVPKGQRMQVLNGGTNSLYGMNWLVKGVIGSPTG